MAKRATHRTKEGKAATSTRFRTRDKDARVAEANEVWRLFLADGKTTDEIAAALDVQPTRVTNVISNRLRQFGPAELARPELARPAGIQRALEMYEAMRAKAVNEGDPAAAGAALKASDQLNRLGGGYPAEQVEHKVKVEKIERVIVDSANPDG